MQKVYVSRQYSNSPGAQVAAAGVPGVPRAASGHAHRQTANIVSRGQAAKLEVGPRTVACIMNFPLGLLSISWLTKARIRNVFR
jgi:hypothetical protein